MSSERFITSLYANKEAFNMALRDVKDVDELVTDAIDENRIDLAMAIYRSGAQLHPLTLVRLAAFADTHGDLFELYSAAFSILSKDPQYKDKSYKGDHFVEAISMMLSNV